MHIVSVNHLLGVLLCIHLSHLLAIDFLSRSRIAKNAMSLLRRFDATNQFPVFYLNFYGMVAWRHEPLQTSADKLRHAFQAALSLGHVDIAFYCCIHVIKTLLFCANNLKLVLKEIDYYLHLLKTYKKEFSINFLLIFRETVSLLIDNGNETSIEATPSLGDLNDPGNKLRESAFFYKAMQSYWTGHTDRCRNYSEKCASILAPMELRSYMSKYYHGEDTLFVEASKFFTRNSFSKSHPQSLSKLAFPMSRIKCI